MLFTITSSGQVVDELRALVEKRGVVFVALDHEMLRVVQARALAEILRDAADHVGGIEPGALQDPGEQRGRRRFSVRAGDDEVVFSAQEELLQRLRQREVVELAIEHRLDLRVAARDGVADDDEVRVRREVLRRGSLR